MKLNHCLLLIALLTVYGCSSIYTVKDTASKDPLYRDFNSLFKDKTVYLTFKDGRSFTLDNGAFIKDDTLYTEEDSFVKKPGSAALSGLYNIIYSSNDYKSGTILFKNGRRLYAEDLRIADDTLDYSLEKKFQVAKNIAPVSRFRKASYKNRWLGILPRTAIGALTGFALGLAAISILQRNSDSPQIGYAFVYPIPLGAFIGAVWGWLDGYNYIYRFDNSK